MVGHHNGQCTEQVNGKRDNNQQSIQSSDCSVDINDTSVWLVHLSHSEANQIWSLGIDPMAVDWP